jgi:hypothetical protein
MKKENEQHINQCAARLKRNDEAHQLIGSGVLYADDSFVDSIYVLTAAHCLFEDKDLFQKPFKSLIVDIYNPATKDYNSIPIEDLSLSCISNATKDLDLGVIKLNKEQVLQINPNIPKTKIICDKDEYDTFIAKGFSKATNGKELDTIKATWNNEVLGDRVFKLTLESDYIKDYIEGFSGSGIYLKTNDDFFLMGIFIRFRMEEKGRIIDAQYISPINQLLDSHFMPTLKTTYIGAGGISAEFFEKNVTKEVKNLGPVFNEKLNVKTDTVKAFDTLAKNERFSRLFIQIFDKWLTKECYYRRETSSNIGDLEQKMDVLKTDIKNKVGAIKFGVEDFIDIKPIEIELKKFCSQLNKRNNELWERIRNKEKKLEKEDLQNDVERLNEMESYFHSLSYEIEKLPIDLANVPLLIIYGEAGCGKSHVLGDVATSRLQTGKPTLIFLGRDFNGKDSIEDNIIRILQVNIEFKTFMNSLNSIGKQMNTRVLILIDAINETEEKEMWANQLAGFAEELKEYPAVGMALSVRTTYQHDVLPESFFKKEGKVTLWIHQGFKGNEHKALQMFCEYYNLQLPNFPLLNPEYRNPLFMHMACIVAQQTVDKRLQSGYFGLMDVFDKYKAYMDKKFDKKHRDYKNLHVASKSIETLTVAMCNANKTRLPFAECYNFLKDKVGDFRGLLNDLIDECILTKSPGYLDDKIDYVSFTYQRLNDYFSAEYMLSDCFNKDSVIKKFGSKKFRTKLADNINRAGIEEQLAILLPEKFGLELFDVMDKSNFESYYFNLLTWSLKWRSAQSIDKNKILFFLKDPENEASIEEWYDAVMCMAAIPYHPFNGDYCTNVLLKHSMGDRDSFLQMFFLNYSAGENNEPSNIERLIEWAWTPGISYSVDTEVARLAAQTMVWFLSSTKNSLRDKSTKALVNLLEHQTDALLAVMQTMVEVDDTYIQERLYAVAYGCILRTKEQDCIHKIAIYTYNTIFKYGKPPLHILLRDYACGIVDYAYYKGAINDIDISLARPPYNAVMPEFPSEEDIDKLEIDDKYQSETYRMENNAILNSVVYGLADFGNKIVEPAVHEFVACSFKTENKYREFMKPLRGNKRKIIKLFIQFAEKIEYYNKQREQHPEWEKNLPEDKRIGYEFFKNGYPKILSLLQKECSAEESDMIQKEFIPHLITKKSNMSDVELDALAIRYWIVQRVFELGYDCNKHGKYDQRASRIDSYYQRSDRDLGRLERIGKKYEWIALYEILGCLTDNYPVEYYWDTSKQIIYDGAWQNFLRDCDPVCITHRYDDDKQDEMKEQHFSWIDHPDYRYWNLPTEIWLNSIEDLQTPSILIQKTDNKEQQWLTMYDYKSWYEPKKLGTKEWSSRKRYFYTDICAYIVRKTDKERIINHAKNKNLFGMKMPSYDTNLYLITRERFWSRGYKLLHKEEKSMWKNLYNGCPYKVMATSEPLNGNIEDDHSGTRASYKMPCHYLVNEIGLDYGEVDGDMINNKGEIVATVNPNRTNQLMMRQNDLLTFLQQKKLDIIWVVKIEKVYNPGELESNSIEVKVPSGVFWLDESQKIQGKLNLFKRIN